MLELGGWSVLSTPPARMASKDSESKENESKENESKDSKFKTMDEATRTLYFAKIENGTGRWC